MRGGGKEAVEWLLHPPFRSSEHRVNEGHGRSWVLKACVRLCDPDDKIQE